ncbi:MAG: tyrosine--tRNA ligase, partial [candidate division Zixibacteria bacterium]|nr:tyrosine--tRNA ligase [candidate division Zixibacteria bacterium]
DATAERLVKIKQALSQPDVNPMTIKKQLGEKLVDMYHPNGAGKQAREEFERVFSKKQLPDDMPTKTAAQLADLEIDPKKIYLVHLIAKSGLAKSNSEARKLISAGGVSLNGDKVTDVDYEFELAEETVLKVGKRRFLKICPN